MKVILNSKLLPGLLATSVWEQHYQLPLLVLTCSKMLPWVRLMSCGAVLKMVQLQAMLLVGLRLVQQ